MFTVRTRRSWWMRIFIFRPFFSFLLFLSDVPLWLFANRKQERQFKKQSDDMTQNNTWGGGQRKSLNETDNWWDDDGGPDGSGKQILRLKTRHSGARKRTRTGSGRRRRWLTGRCQTSCEWKRDANGALSGAALPAVTSVEAGGRLSWQ